MPGSDISLVVPTYNEAKNIVPLIKRAEAALPGSTGKSCLPTTTRRTAPPTWFAKSPSRMTASAWC